MRAARKQNRIEEAAAAQRPAAPAPGSGPEAGASPALALQRALEERWEADAAGAGFRRWSPRSTLLFSGAISLLLWIAIALIVMKWR